VHSIISVKPKPVLGTALTDTAKTI